MGQFQSDKYPFPAIFPSQKPPLPGEKSGRWARFPLEIPPFIGEKASFWPFSLEKRTFFRKKCKFFLTKQAFTPKFSLGET